MRLLLYLFLAGVCPANEWLREVQNRAAVFESQRDWAQAEAVYRRALEEAAGPAAFRIRMALCEMVFNQGHHAEAGRLLRQLGTPGSPEEAAQAHNAWAALHLVSGNLTAAMRELGLALAAEESAATLHNLASLEAQTGELRAAEEHQRRALSLWRGQFGERHEYVRRALISLSSIQGLRKDWRGAAESLRDSLSIAESPDALSNYAIVLERLKQGKQAREIRRRIHGVVVPNALVDVRALRGAGPGVVVR